MARPRKLLNEQKTYRTKEVQEELKEIEKGLNDITKLDSEPPEWMSEGGKEEYIRLYPLLNELPVANLDSGLVTAYCEAYATFIETVTLLQEQDSIIETRHGSKLNPLHQIKKDAFATMLSVAPKIGMSIDSRMKIMANQNDDKKDDDPFMDLMKND